MCLSLQPLIQYLKSCYVCGVWHRGYECGSVLFLSDVGWSWRVVRRRIPGVGLILGRACLLLQCVGCEGYECGSVLFLSDVGWSWRCVKRRIPGVSLFLGRACLLLWCVECVGYECVSVLLLSDVGRISGEALCLDLACLLMQCIGNVMYMALQQSCGQCLMAFVRCRVVEGRGRYRGSYVV